MNRDHSNTVASASGVYQDRVDEWVHTLSAAELWSQLNRVSIWFKLAAFAAFTASSFFVVGYFAGSLQVSRWDTEQWLYGLVLGVPFTATLTMFQYFLYSSGHKKAAYSSLLAFVVAAGFGIMTEIGQGMERQENRVHQRSLDSPVLHSALQAIENSGAAIATLPVNRDAVAKLAHHQYELTRCQRHLKTHGQWRVDKCVNYEQERIARYQALVDSDSLHREQQLSAQAGQTAQLLHSAKQLERDEKHYHAFIRFLYSLFGFSSYLSANFLLSLLLVMAFEYAFHYLGNFERDTKAALRLRGYEVKRFRAKPPKQRDAERPPQPLTLQNQYMPAQQVGFSPLQNTVTLPPLPPLPAASLATATAAKTPPSSSTVAPVRPPQNSSRTTSSQPGLFSTYLSKALHTGKANTPAEVKQFLQGIHTCKPQANTTHSATLKSGSEPSSPNRTRTPPTVTDRGGHKNTVNSANSQSKSGLNRAAGTPAASPVSPEQGCTRTPQSEPEPLSAALQRDSEKLYPLWREQILRQQIKPTYRPGKALLNQHLCQDKRRQTPTPLELDSITRQWFARALQEQVIVPNSQQGRGHARYVVNPDKVIVL